MHKLSCYHLKQTLFNLRRLFNLKVSSKRMNHPTHNAIGGDMYRYRSLLFYEFIAQTSICKHTPHHHLIITTPWTIWVELPRYYSETQKQHEVDKSVTLSNIIQRSQINLVVNKQYISSGKKSSIIHIIQHKLDFTLLTELFWLDKNSSAYTIDNCC